VHPTSARSEPTDSPAPANGADPAQTHVSAELKHSSPLIACRFDSAGRFVFAGAQDNTVQRWEIASGQKTSFAGHGSWVRGIASSPNGECVFTAAYDGQMKCWPSGASEPTPAWSQYAHQGWVRALAVSPDARWIVSTGNDHQVRIWNTGDGSPVRGLSGHASHVYNAAFYPDGQHLVSADLKGQVIHWDPATGSELRRLDASVLCKYDESFKADCGGVRSMAFNPDGRFLACAGITDVTNAFAGVGKPVIVLFDWVTGARKHLLRPKEEFTGVMWGVAFHPSGFVIGAGGGSSGGALWFWRPDNPQSFFHFKLPNQVRDLDLHPDGLRLAVAHFDGALRILKMAPKQ
jgi:WD40 repeat protein